MCICATPTHRCAILKTSSKKFRNACIGASVCTDILNFLTSSISEAYILIQDAQPISRTCHTLAEVEEWMPKVEYMTLSPIFDSLSKAGYKKGFNHDQLASLPSGKVVALGGVEPSKLKELRQYPFVGFAMLGYLFDGGSIESLKAKLQLLDEAQYL